MKESPPKATFFLLGGGVLLLCGAVLSIFSHSHSMRLGSAAAIIVGLGLLRISKFNFRLPGQTGVQSMMSGSWMMIDKLELSTYAVAAILFVVTIVAALLGYFSDFLTYSFVTVFAIAVAFRVFRRIF